MSTSKNSAKNTTENQTHNESTNINLQDTEGVAVGSAGRDVTVISNSLDGGAIEGAFDFAGDTANAAFSFGERVSDNNLRAVDSSLDFAGSVSSDAFDKISDANDRSLDFGDNVVETGFNFGLGALDTVRGFGEAALQNAAQSSEATAKTLGAAITSAANASRTDSSQSFDKLTKYGTIALSVIGVAIAAVFIFKK